MWGIFRIFAEKENMESNRYTLVADFGKGKDFTSCGGNLFIPNNTEDVVKEFSDFFVA